MPEWATFAIALQAGCAATNAEPQSRLLLRAVPHIAIAIETHRNAQQHQAERHVNELKAQIGKVEALVQELFDGSRRLVVEVRTGFVEDTPHNLGSLSTLPTPAAPAMAPSPGQLGTATLANAAGAVINDGTVDAPRYTLKVVRNVPDAWREWSQGIQGGPAVRDLEAKWGYYWRPGAQARVAFSRRKTIWDEIIRRIAHGTPEATAVQQVEELRAGKSLNKLREHLQRQARLRSGR